MIIWQNPILIPVIPSTQDYLLNQNPPQLNTVIYTHHQTHGRGTHNKSWRSQKNDLTFSFQINHDLDEAHLIMVTALSIQKIFPPSIMIKPPNDLLYDGQKCGGILIEQKPKEESFRATIGVGVNLTPKADDNFSFIQSKQPHVSLIQSFQRQFNAHLMMTFDDLFQTYLASIPWQKITIKHQEKIGQFKALHADFTVDLDIGTFPMAHLRFEII